MEVIHLLPQDCDPASASRAHSPVCGAESYIPRATDHEGDRADSFRLANATDQGGNRGGGSGSHTGAHLGPLLNEKCRRRKRQNGKLGRDSEEVVAMAGAREDVDDFVQAIPQDGTMKVQQIEVFFRRHPEEVRTHAE